MHVLQHTIDTLAQELAGLDQRRSDLEAAIGSLLRLTGEARAMPPRVEPPPAPPSAESTPPATPPALKSLHPPLYTGDQVVDMLRQHGGSMMPCDLATALGLKVPTLCHRLKALVAQGLVEVTGTTHSRRVSLPTARPVAPPKPSLASAVARTGSADASVVDRDTAILARLKGAGATFSELHSTLPSVTEAFLDSALRRLRLKGKITQNGERWRLA